MMTNEYRDYPEGTPMRDILSRVYWGRVTETPCGIPVAAEAQPQRAGRYYFEKREAPADVRADFPILSRRVNGHPLVWLDNAATTQKPRCVLDAVARYYETCNSNVHRGAHTLAREATAAFEEARNKAGALIGAPERGEVVFVRGATEGINLVAASWGGAHVREGDEIILTELEHHSNIVPWQLLAQRTGALLRVAPILTSGDVDMAAYERLFTPRTRLAAFSHVSNVLGTVNPAAEMCAVAHRHGALALVDGAQSAAHLPVNVKELGADFFVMSGHKLYGPTGIGVLYGRRELLEKMPPYQGGGGMIDSVTFEDTRYRQTPEKFEAGTGNIADAVGLGAAAEYLQRLGLMRIRAHENMLTQRMTAGLGRIPGVTLIGAPREKAGVVAFLVDGVAPEQIAQRLDAQGIAVRAGHHCAQPALRHYGLNSAARASLGVYNTPDDVDALVNAVAGLAGR
jgi:cysteine desulfurase/selenocysteine lyase